MVVYLLMVIMQQQISLSVDMQRSEQVHSDTVPLLLQLQNHNTHHKTQRKHMVSLALKVHFGYGIYGVAGVTVRSLTLSIVKSVYKEWQQ